MLRSRHASKGTKYDSIIIIVCTKCDQKLFLISRQIDRGKYFRNIFSQLMIGSNKNSHDRSAFSRWIEYEKTRLLQKNVEEVTVSERTDCDYYYITRLVQVRNKKTLFADPDT